MATRAEPLASAIERLRLTPEEDANAQTALRTAQAEPSDSMCETHINPQTPSPAHA